MTRGDLDEKKENNTDNRISCACMRNWFDYALSACLDADEFFQRNQYNLYNCKQADPGALYV